MESSNNFIIIQRSIYIITFFEKVEISEKIKENDTFGIFSFFFFFKKFRRQRNLLSRDYRFIRDETDNWTKEGKQRGRRDSEKVPSETNNVECPSCIIYSSVKIPGERAPSARISSYPINIFENIIFINNIFHQEFVSIHGNETRISW